MGRVHLPPQQAAAGSPPPPCGAQGGGNRWRFRTALTKYSAMWARVTVHAETVRGWALPPPEELTEFLQEPLPFLGTAQTSCWDFLLIITQMPLLT